MGLSQRSLVAVAAGSAVALVALALVFAATSGGVEPAGTSPAWADALAVLGGPLVLPLATGAIALGLAVSGRRDAAWFLVVAVAGAGVLTYLLKGVLQALGADHDGGRLSDFPSGHEASIVALVLALLVIARPSRLGRLGQGALAVLAIAATASMAWGRVAAGAHTTLDVVGGAVLAVGWLAVCLLAWPPYRVDPA